jgi:microcystin-dependent protein
MADAANIETSLDPLRNRLEVVLAELAAGKVEIGEIRGWAGPLDPPVDASGIQRSLLIDGRLIDRTVHSIFYSRFGHLFNGGVDPGSNMVRIPDARGRVLVGADNMGTAQGAASRIPNSPRTLGQSGGGEQQTITEVMLPPHTHQEFAGSGGAGAQVGINFATSWTNANGQATSTITGPGNGVSSPFNKLSPYQIVNYIIRVR